MTCLHPRALGVDTGDYVTPARLLVPVGMYPDLDRWCPDCGAVRIWKGNANRPTWLRPGEGDVIELTDSTNGRRDG